MSVKNYNAGIYCRLSKDDLRNDESLSIENQKKILTNNCKEQGWSIFRNYCDDGKTGVNFDRKGFQELYADAQSGKINLIIIKDLSRFGRNYLECGMYFEEISQLIGVRFVSLMERLDTIDPNCPAIKMLPFYNIFNEWHSQSTSEKIKITLLRMAKDGKFYSSNAPYGYQKDPENKYHLIIDSESSVIIRRIFEMRAKNYSYLAIAKKLNEEGILSPKSYSKKEKTYFWSNIFIERILKNQVYVGTIANGKSRVTSFKNHKKIYIDESNWVVRENMHEPIISEDLWSAVCAINQKSTRVRSGKSKDITTFSGMLKCSDCGHSVTVSICSYTTAEGVKRVNKNYSCSNFKSCGSVACSAHRINEKNLSAILIEDIREKAKLVSKNSELAKKKFLKIKNQFNGKQLNSDKEKLRKIERRLTEIKKLMASVYEDKVNGKIPEGVCIEFLERYENEKCDLIVRQGELKLSVEKTSSVEKDVDNFIALIQKYNNISEIDRNIVVDLIEHIEIGKSSETPQNIRIFYKFIGLA